MLGVGVGWVGSGLGTGDHPGVLPGGRGVEGWDGDRVNGAGTMH